MAVWNFYPTIEKDQAAGIIERRRSAMNKNYHPENSHIVGRTTRGTWNTIRKIIAWFFRGGSSGSICL
jgi:hypothetical protein